MDKDKATTIIGAAGAVITAINPVMGGIAEIGYSLPPLVFSHCLGISQTRNNV
jgi:hypothetical protein